MVVLQRKQGVNVNSFLYETIAFQIKLTVPLFDSGMVSNYLLKRLSDLGS